MGQILRKIDTIVTDLDGTLLNSNSRISDFNKQILQKCIDQNIYLILATGRRVYSTLPYAQEFKGEIGVISNNGQIIYLSPSQKRIKEYYLDIEVTHVVLNFLKENGFHPLLHVDQWEDGIDYLTEIPDKLHFHTPYIEKENQRCLKVKNIFDCNLSKVTVCCVFGDSIDELYQLKEKLNSNITDKNFRCLITHIPRIGACMEILCKNTSKWNAIIELMNHKNRKIGNVISFGDQENDIEMLQNAFIGIAVKNATPAVQSVASMVSKFTNEEDAVANTLIELGIVKT